MVPDQVLANCVESLVRESGPSAVTSLEDLIRQLEAKLGMDLSSKASFINEQIYILLGPHFAQIPTSDVVAAADGSHFAQISASSSLFEHLPQKTNVPSLFESGSQNQFESAAAQAPVAVSKESAPAAPKRRGGPGGLSKVCGVSPELQVIVGEPTMARTEIVKQLWAYIRRNNLQDPNNKRKIICNDELRLVFETDSTDMFKMNKLLAKHIISLERAKEPGPDTKKLKKSDRENAVPETQTGQYPVVIDRENAVSEAQTGQYPVVIDRENAVPEAQTGQYPVVISDGLAEFLGTGEREILYSEALRRVWDYIEANHLEDHRNSMVLCDTKLQRLFACESVSASAVSKMLAQHLFKQS